MFGYPQQPTVFDGFPLEVMSICHPFICVSNGDQVFAIDQREVEIRVVSPHYAEAMRATPAQLKSRGPSGRKRKRNKKERPHRNLCPVCKKGIRTQRLHVDAGEKSRWVWFCPVCDSHGDPVIQE